MGLIHADSYAVIINEGTVAFTGETVQQFYVGGIASFVSKYAIPATVKLINTGDIVATGKCGEGLEGNCIVSGIIGSMKAPIEGAQCFCKIDAPNYTALQGMLSGKARVATSVLYTNAKVGGSICTGYDEEQELESWKDIASNLSTLLYGATTLTEEQISADVYTIISSKDAIDYTVPQAPTTEE
jgi:tetrahydromethanopterin S-methyltransferase subunit D